MYEVRNAATNEVLFEGETKTECRNWIRMGDRDTWDQFVCVDSMGQPVELWGMK
jgi:hypothetical protein